MTALLQLDRAERRLANWIDTFFSWSSAFGSPALYQQWAGISAIAAAVERKVWVRTLGKPFYPNLYVLLVGPPGVGKTNLTARVSDLFRHLPEHHLAPSAVSKASLMDALADAHRTIPLPGQIPPVLQFNSMFVNSNELGVLLPGYDNEFMAALTDLYDGEPYMERKRGKDLKLKIDKPQLNLLAACTPNFLVSTLPEGAWEQGFMSRCVIIYSGEPVHRSVFTEVEFDDKTQNDLIHDLKIIGNRNGQFKFTAELKDAFETWDRAGMPPVPDHPKLLSYCARRRGQLLKLMQIASISESNEMIITLPHFEQARDWLVEAELYMPEVFKAMRTGGDAAAIRELYHFAIQHYARTSKPLPESFLIEFLQEKIPAHSVPKVIDLMVRADLLEAQFNPAISRNMYIPKAKRGMNLD